MKLFARFLGLMAICLILLRALFTFSQENIFITEITENVTESINETQTIIAQNIKDKLNGTRASETVFNNNQEYIQFFIDDLANRINSNTHYTVDVYDIDYEKGLLSVEVQCAYKSFLGRTKTISIRKTNIVDVVESEVVIDSPGTDVITED